jgi:hypothetical protein
MLARQKVESNLTEREGNKRPIPGMEKLASIIIVQRSSISLE